MKYSYHLEIFQEPLANSKEEPVNIGGTYCIRAVSKNKTNMLKAIKRNVNQYLREQINLLEATEEAPGH